MQEMQETLQFPVKDKFQTTTVSVVIPALNEAEICPTSFRSCPTGSTRLSWWMDILQMRR